MGLYKVVVRDGQKALDNLAGASMGEGCPLGMWASFENDTAPNDNWIKAGETFDATKYPALALYLGDNTVPMKFDHSKLGELEDFTNTGIQQYDGMVFVQLAFQGGSILINDVNVASSYSSITSGAAGNGLFVEFKHGDKVTLSGRTDSPKVRYYKHPLFIKATSNIQESEATGILDLINQRDSYSTTEVNTGKKWIDGKPIYRRVYVSTTSVGDGTVISTGIDNCISVSGYTISSGSKNMMSSDLAGYLYLDSNNELRLSKGGGVSAAYIVFEYTKTTD